MNYGLVENEKLIAQKTNFGYRVCKLIGKKKKTNSYLRILKNQKATFHLNHKLYHLISLWFTKYFAFLKIDTQNNA